jgi:hypothetical protein
VISEFVQSLGVAESRGKSTKPQSSVINTYKKPERD